MTTKVILVAHGNLAGAFIDSMEMIIGPRPENEVVGISFTLDDALETLKDRIEENIIAFDLKADEHLVVCCDMQGGSPFNASFLLSKQYPMSIICGMNLPLLLEFMLKKDEYTTKEEIQDLLEQTKEFIKVF